MRSATFLVSTLLSTLKTSLNRLSGPIPGIVPKILSPSARPPQSLLDPGHRRKPAPTPLPPTLAIATLLALTSHSFGPFLAPVRAQSVRIAQSSVTITSGPGTTSPGTTSTSNAGSATTCHIAIAHVGLYQEPNVRSHALGTLRPGDRLWVGPGSTYDWLRVVSPQVGWLEASAVRPGTAQLCAGTPWVPSSSASVAPAALGAAASAPRPVAVDQTGWTACEVLANSAVYLRNQPIQRDRTILARLQAGRHFFKVDPDRTFIDSTANGRLHWIYVTAPQTGWILTGISQNQQRPQVFLIGPGCGFGVG